MSPVIIAAVALLPLPAIAADGWDEFTANLAADLGPLIALFEEQVTKQFLSELMSKWDNVIFAMAPLGIFDRGGVSDLGLRQIITQSVYWKGARKSRKR
ncbi:hypothetical protein AJ79_00293 [Helicocarpus griseus UAMH5409]|uniref:Uncharacterized protein n=1 Tax=Helicocarpus griseus UAMH5409 TaxID=1447875 RepID=A0A2B7YE43_9EURO|nr:hypothetical protein AJ79_00293 [Helicocarpus griseus UAMH5409]